ncbi:MAG: universal stress protein [Gemmataceae bacterium]
MMKRILAGLGGTPFSQSTIQYSVELARRHNAEVTGVTVVDVNRLIQVGPVPIGGNYWADELRRHRIRVTHERIEEVIQNFETACRDGDIRHQVKREERREPFDLMLSSARYHDLMIFGLRSIFEYGVIDESYHSGSDLLIKLITGGIRPILTVSETYRPIRRVLICYSGSMESAKTMKQFVRMRLWPDVQLRIVTFDHKPDKGQRLLTNAAEYCRAHGFTPEVTHIPGPPKDQVLPVAEEWDADLIVMGNSARNLLLRQIFGETALHVIQHADRPLFLSQ